MRYSLWAIHSILREAGGGRCGSGDGAGAESIASFLGIICGHNQVIITAGIGGNGLGSISAAITDNRSMVVGAGGKTGKSTAIDCVMSDTGNLVT